MRFGDWTFAETRAYALLRSYLTPVQRAQLAAHGGFAVRGSEGGLYVLLGSERDMVFDLAEGHPVSQRKRGYGTYNGAIPGGDALLAVSLAIAADEGHLRDYACTPCTRRSGCCEASWATVDAILRVTRPEPQGGRFLRAVVAVGWPFAPYR